MLDLLGSKWLREGAAIAQANREEQRNGAEIKQTCNLVNIQNMLQKGI